MSKINLILENIAKHPSINHAKIVQLGDKHYLIAQINEEAEGGSVGEIKPIGEKETEETEETEEDKIEKIAEIRRDPDLDPEEAAKETVKDATIEDMENIIVQNKKEGEELKNKSGFKNAERAAVRNNPDLFKEDFVRFKN